MGQYRGNEYVEHPSAKRVRILLIVLYFLEILMTTFPFCHLPDGEGNLRVLTAFQCIIQPGGYGSPEAIKTALICAPLLLLPAVSFFFCILDKKTNAKNFVSGATCVINTCIITFGFASYIDIGGILSIILYIICLFFTAMSFQASSLQ